MATYPAVIGVKDGQDNAEATFNVPINALRERTDYLKDRQDQLVGQAPFESVRVVDFLLDDVDTPAQYDLVYLDSETNTLKPGLSQVILNTSNQAEASDSTLVVGILLATSGSVGTVMLYGRLVLEGVLQSQILQSGEEFRSGAYYLSSVEPGKITRVSTGVRSVVGVFTEDPSNPGYLYEVILNPQWSDVQSAHSHQGFVLPGIPAGANESTGTDITQDFSRVRGFKPDYYLVPAVHDVDSFTATNQLKLDSTYGDVTDKYLATGFITVEGATNAVNNGKFQITSVSFDGTNTIIVTSATTLVTEATTSATATASEPPFRLFVVGEWLGQGDPTYTFELVNGGSDFSDAYIRWSTDDGSDDTGGATGVRITSYEEPVSIGTKGIQVVLEKVYDSTLPEPDWNNADFNVLPAASTDTDTRTWTVKVPDRVQGWLPYWVRGAAAYTGSATAPEYTLRVFGRYANPDKRSSETLQITCTGAGDFALAGVDLQIADRDGAVIDTLTNVALGGPAYWVENSGDYELWLMVDRYRSDGTPAPSTTAALTDSWSLEFNDYAPGAAFGYNLAYDAAMQAYYPPTPLDSVELQANGVSQPQRDSFRDDYGAYKADPHGIYWYGDLPTELPFPPDFVSLSSPGTEETQVDIKLFLAKSRFQNSGIVTSITGSEETGVKVLDAKTGLPATTGDIELVVTPAINVSSSDRGGFKVMKTVNSNGQIETGPVVESIKPGPGLIIKAEDANYPNQGKLQLELSGTGFSSGEFTKTTLLNAKQKRVPGRSFSYIELLPWNSTSANNVPTAFISEFRVPQNFGGNYRVAFYATIFGLDAVDVSANSIAKQFAGLNVTYSVLQDLTLPGGGGEFVFVSRNLLTVGPTGVLETELKLVNDVPFGKTSVGYVAYDTFLMHNDPDIQEVDGQVTAPVMPIFPQAGEDPAVVTAGNLVSLRISRTDPNTAHAGNTQEYTGGIGFMFLGWRLIEQ